MPITIKRTDKSTESYKDLSKAAKPSPHLSATRWGQDQFGWWMTLVIKNTPQVFRWISPGTFQMGSPIEEIGRFNGETQHSVRLTKGYWLADTTCTQALWESVMGRNPAYFKTHPRNPVEQVSWDQITKLFIPKLKQLTGLTVRLPTEAEWEYACRAGTTSPFNLGENITMDQVNFNGNHPFLDVEIDQYRKCTVPVTSMESANAWGLHEMHGNVWEWCQDWHANYQGKEAVNSINPIGPKSGTNRVLRGGSWLFHHRDIRSAFRDAYPPEYRSNLIGFRLVLVVD
ncbi:MAG: formylglycine-generating enzyme family protein [Thiotrichaceae bacterium]